MGKTLLGLIVTAVWVAVAVILFFQNTEGNLKINEIGDYIAGVVAPLAFFWFVLGYYQQAEEIRENTKALVSQRDELERQAQLMSEQSYALKKTSEALLEHVRPYVVCYLKSEGIMIRVVLENTGSRPAQNISLTFDPPLETFADDRFLQDHVKKPGYLAPGGRIVTVLSTTDRQLGGQDSAALRSKVTAQYSDIQGNSYNESFTLALDVIGQAAQQPEPVDAHLREMRKHMQSISDSLKQIQRSVPK